MARISRKNKFLGFFPVFNFKIFHPLITVPVSFSPLMRSHGAVSGFASRPRSLMIFCTSSASMPTRTIRWPEVIFRMGTWYFRPTAAMVSSCSGVTMPAGIRVVTAKVRPSRWRIAPSVGSVNALHDSAAFCVSFIFFRAYFLTSRKIFSPGTISCAFCIILENNLL